MKKKTILVTGGAGFIGTNFIRHTLSARKDWRIINLDALTYAGNPANLEDLSHDQAKRYHFIHGDILDTDLLDRIFSRENFEGVIHFAAESHVNRSIIGPKAFLNTNVINKVCYNNTINKVLVWR
ncbi:MAG: GDP-mannose 4,6-dehydratase [Candidatus Omnitrophica bacterium]|nr:GDP-mannose 4,6-dehydratase [Candidatus Omnitrophota bacterium]